MTPEASEYIGTVAYAEDNPWMVRGRVLGVLPDEGADLSVADTGLVGDVDINPTIVGIGFGYKF